MNNVNAMLVIEVQLSVREHLQKAIFKKCVIVLSIKGHRIFKWKAKINGHLEGKLMS